MRPLPALGLLLSLGGGVCGAAMFVPSPSTPSSAAQTTAEASLAEARAAGAERKPAVQIRQAPVPIRWSSRHEPVSAPRGPTISDLVNQIDNEPNAGLPTAELATVEQANVDQQSDPAGIDRVAARAAIEADGYKGVRDLAQSGNGKWTARALRGATEITVSVGADGSVSAN